MTPRSTMRLCINSSPVIMFSISLQLFSHDFALFSVQMTKSNFNTRSCQAKLNWLPEALCRAFCKAQSHIHCHYQHQDCHHYRRPLPGPRIAYVARYHGFVNTISRTEQQWKRLFVQGHTIQRIETD